MAFLRDLEEELRKSLARPGKGKRFARSIENYSAGLGDVGLNVYEKVPNFFARVGAKATGTPTPQLDLSKYKIKPVTGEDKLSRNIGKVVGDIAVTQVGAQAVKPALRPKVLKPLGQKAGKMIASPSKTARIAGSTLANISEGIPFTVAAAVKAPFEGKSAAGSIATDIAIDAVTGPIFGKGLRKASKTIRSTQDNVSDVMKSQSGALNISALSKQDLTDLGKDPKTIKSANELLPFFRRFASGEESSTYDLVRGLKKNPDHLPSISELVTKYNVNPDAANQARRLHSGDEAEIFKYFLDKSAQGNPKPILVAALTSIADKTKDPKILKYWQASKDTVQSTVGSSIRTLPTEAEIARAGRRSFQEVGELVDSPGLKKGVSQFDQKSKGFFGLDQKGGINFGARVGKDFDPEELSKNAKNSFLNNPKDAGDKANRLTGEGLSFREAGTGLATNNKYVRNRIVIGKDDSGNTIIKDGRHLLEAYRRLGKPVPNDKVLIESSLPERGFVDTIRKSALPEQTKEAVENLNTRYRVKTNEATLSRAGEALQNDYMKEYTNIVKGNVEMTPETVAKGQILISDLSRAGNHEAAAEVANSLMRLGTKSGRTVQAFSMLNRLSPEGMLIYAQKNIDTANKNRGVMDGLLGRQDLKLSPEGSRKIIGLMEQAQQLPEGQEKSRLVKEAMEIINKEIPPSFNEMFDSFRYENMLSNPRTQARNIYYNMFNTFLTRPASMAVETPYDWVRSTMTGAERQRYLSDVPDYYKEVIKSGPEGGQMFMRSLKGEVPIEQPDLRMIRRASRGGPISRFMEGMDRFNMALIAGAEKADLMKKGIPESEAVQRSQEVARRFLLRSPADPLNKSGQGYLFSKIDGVSSWVSKLPGRKWLVPFIQTPTNVAKQWIEYSPAGIASIPGAKDKTEQLAKMTLGTIATAVGAKLAAEGKTTWAPPRGAEDKQVFYATGRKPYSVKIGDKWVPMVYAGPFALALALPAAIEHMERYERKSVTRTQSENYLKGIQDVYGFLLNSTPLSGLNNYVQVLSGDPDYNLPSSLGFSASQMVPYVGLLNYVNSIIDPTFRKKSSFSQSFKGSIPGLSKQNPPYLEPGGVPAQRDTINYFLPYDVGIEDEKFEPQYQQSIYEQQFAPLKSWEGRVRSVYRDHAKGLISRQEMEKKVKDLYKEREVIINNLNKERK